MPAMSETASWPTQRYLGTPARKFAAGVGLFLSVCLISVAGYLIAGWTLPDAFYMVIITIFGVGYGEVQPVETWPLRMLTTFVIVGGYGAAIFAVGGLVQMVVDGEISDAMGARRMNREIDQLEGHAIICGLGRMGTSLATELERAERPFVAIESDPATLARASQLGYLTVNGDAADEEALRRAGIERAEVLATVLSDDATNVFVTLTARAMNPALRIVARGENRSTESKLLTCGADQVVLPTTIGATKMSQLITRPTAEELLERLARSGETTLDLEQVGLSLDQLHIEARSPVAGTALGSIEVRGAHGYLVVGVRHADDTTVLSPDSDVVLDVGDTVIVLGYRDDIPHVVGRFTTPTSEYRYRGQRLDHET